MELTFEMISGWMRTSDTSIVWNHFYSNEIVLNIASDGSGVSGVSDGPKSGVVAINFLNRLNDWFDPHIRWILKSKMIFVRL